MNNKKVRYIILFVTTLLVCAFVFMPGHVIFCRYMSTFSTNVVFTSASADRSYLYDSEGKSVSEILWPSGSESASFIVTNYYENELPARQDLSVKIRVVVPDLDVYKNMEFTVYDTASTYEAKASFLSSNSPMYSECREWYKNKGIDEDIGYWIYYFSDTGGEEVRWLLPGGNISERTFNLQMYTTSTAIDTSYLMIDIIDVHNQKGAIQQ